MFDYRRSAIIGLRVVQLLTIASAITGGIWASSDWLLLYVLVEAPVTPLSVLLIMYGIVGTFITEAPIRLLKKQEKN